MSNSQTSIELGSGPFGIIWGADNIAKRIGRSRQQTFYLLASGKLPAKKVGDQWAISEKRLREFFEVE
jgi:hypothetical protein